MHALADWIAELVQILYCIKINICKICSIVDQSVDLCYILVDLFVTFQWTFLYILADLSLSGEGEFFRIQKTPPPGYSPCIFS